MQENEGFPRRKQAGCFQTNLLGYTNIGKQPLAVSSMVEDEYYWC